MNLVRMIKVDNQEAFDRFLARHKPDGHNPKSELGNPTYDNTYVVSMDESEWKAFEGGFCDGVKYAALYTLLYMEKGDSQPGEHKMQEPGATQP